MNTLILHCLVSQGAYRQLSLYCLVQMPGHLGALRMGRMSPGGLLLQQAL